MSSSASSTSPPSPAAPPCDAAQLRYAGRGTAFISRPLATMGECEASHCNRWQWMAVIYHHVNDLSLHCDISKLRPMESK